MATGVIGQVWQRQFFLIKCRWIGARRLYTPRSDLKGVLKERNLRSS